MVVQRNQNRLKWRHFDGYENKINGVQKLTFLFFFKTMTPI